MMAEKPVIFAVNAGNDPVAEANCGVSVEAGAPKAIAQGVLELLSLDPEDLEKLGANGHQYIIENHDYKHLAIKFIDILETLI